MAISLQDEKVLRLVEAVKLLPRHVGRKVHTSTLWRWMRVGCKSRVGRRVFLDHIRLGGVLLTSAEALDRFGNELAKADREYFDAQTERDKNKAPKTRTERQRERDVERAESALDKVGW